MAKESRSHFSHDVKGERKREGEFTFSMIRNITADYPMCFVIVMRTLFYVIYFLLACRELFRYEVAE